jgi:nicotinamidase-related amidase
MVSNKVEQKYLGYATRVRKPDPSQAAMLVIDMQEFFRNISEPIIPTVREVISSARKAGIPVIYTQHSHKRPEEDGILGEWWDGNLIGHGTPEAELIPEVEFTEKDKLISKHVYSAFLNTDLDSHLRRIGRSEVIIVGVMTNLCCETTARDAFCRGYRVFFSTDATATATQEFHEATLRNLGFGFAYLVNADDLKYGEG